MILSLHLDTNQRTKDLKSYSIEHTIHAPPKHLNIYFLISFHFKTPTITLGNLRPSSLILIFLSNKRMETVGFCFAGVLAAAPVV